MRITLENEDSERVVVETTTLDHSEAVAPDSTHFELKQEPTNLPGERWDDDRGVTWWRI